MYGNLKSYCTGLYNGKVGRISIAKDWPKQESLVNYFRVADVIRVSQPLARQPFHNRHVLLHRGATMNPDAK